MSFLRRFPMGGGKIRQLSPTQFRLPAGLLPGWSLRIVGGPEGGITPSAVSIENLVPFACPTRADLTGLTAPIPADAVLASPSLAISGGPWDGAPLPLTPDKPWDGLTAGAKFAIDTGSRAGVLQASDYTSTLTPEGLTVTLSIPLTDGRVVLSPAIPGYQVVRLSSTVWRAERVVTLTVVGGVDDGLPVSWEERTNLMPWSEGGASRWPIKAGWSEAAPGPGMSWSGAPDASCMQLLDRARVAGSEKLYLRLWVEGTATLSASPAANAHIPIGMGEWASSVVDPGGPGLRVVDAVVSNTTGYETCGVARYAWQGAPPPGSTLTIRRVMASTSLAVGRYIPTSGAPVTQTDATLGPVQPDGSRSVTLAADTPGLSWTDAPAGWEVVMVDSRTARLQRAVSCTGTSLEVDGSITVKLSKSLGAATLAWANAPAGYGVVKIDSSTFRLQRAPVLRIDGGTQNGKILSLDAKEAVMNGQDATGYPLLDVATALEANAKLTWVNATAGWAAVQTGAKSFRLQPMPTIKDGAATITPASVAIDKAGNVVVTLGSAPSGRLTITDLAGWEIVPLGGLVYRIQKAIGLKLNGTAVDTWTATWSTTATDGTCTIALATDGTLTADTLAPGATLTKTAPKTWRYTPPEPGEDVLLGIPALAFTGDLSAGRTAWQTTTKPLVSGASYCLTALVAVDGVPTYGPGGLFRFVLAGDSPNYGTASWFPTGTAGVWRLEVEGLSVTNPVGRVGFYMAPGQADTRPWVVSSWSLGTTKGRLQPGGTNAPDYTVAGSTVTLRTPMLAGGRLMVVRK